MSASYRRFVALGDSQTEGLNDWDAHGVLLGWADRLARTLDATTSPGLLYANLAVRGARAVDVHDRQLPVALQLEPDLATVAVGMNDVLRHDFDRVKTLDHIEETFASLRATGCQVATMTFPDLAEILPVLRWLRPRELALNEGIRAAAERHGVVVLDLFPLPACADVRMWSRDRIHASQRGHTLIAAGMGGLLGVPGAERQWTDVLGDHPVAPSGRLVRARAVGREVAWVGAVLLPFLARQLRGGTLRSAKRPSLGPLVESVGLTPAPQALAAPP
jgi:lysophospholipase L1-like esterase